MRYSIRPATPDDFDEIIQLWEKCEMLPYKSRVVCWELLLEKSSEDPTMLLVCQLKDSSNITSKPRLLGAVMGVYDPFASYVRLLAVDPDSRGNGLGTELVRSMTQRLKNRGARIIGALMYVWNQPSFNLFKKLGWQQLEDCHCFVYQETRDA